MKVNTKLSRAIAAILSAHAAQAVYAAPAESQTAAPTGLEEVIVTAERRVENLQDVPITIQALTSETLAELNVQNVDDFIKFLPNVTQSTNGPGQGEIFMRGLSIGGGGNQGSGTTGAFPAVAIYLDEQSGQLPGRNLDIYAADLERIEVLEGPQGTLFGGGAEAGVLRYITQKPKLNVTEGSVDAGYGITAHGDPNSRVTAVINLPVISDTLAVRGVFYNDRHGGYINNVPSIFARAPTDLGLARNNGGVVPTNSVAISNNQIAGDAINPLTYTGLRLAGLWKINDDWDALLTQSYQNIDAQGVFYQMRFGTEGGSLTPGGRTVGGQLRQPLSVRLFTPSFGTEEVGTNAVVVKGQVD